MIKKQGCEVIIGAKTDMLFGPVILFGMGGIGVGLCRDIAIGLPPVKPDVSQKDNGRNKGPKTDKTRR